jgi:alkylation response protein AidB-like acyl-CoA dehydrogenase
VANLLSVGHDPIDSIDMNAKPCPGLTALLLSGQMQFSAALFPRRAENTPVSDSGATRNILELLHNTDTRLLEQPTSELWRMLRSAGAFSLRTRLGLSRYATYQTIQKIAEASPSLAVSIGLHSGFGPHEYLPFLGPGPLVSTIHDWIDRDGIYAEADSEPTGTITPTRQTVATYDPSADRYRITGHKVYVSNARIATLIGVTATTRNGSNPTSSVEHFLVDPKHTRNIVGHDHTFTGFPGCPVGEVSLDETAVPAHHRLTLDAKRTGRWSATDVYAYTTGIGRLYVIGAPAQHIIGSCLRASLDFATNRHTDRGPLLRFESPREHIATLRADGFAVDTFLRWSFLGAPEQVLNELAPIKSLIADAAWRAAGGRSTCSGATG